MKYPSIGEFNTLKVKFEKHESEHSSLKKLVKEIEKRLKDLNIQGGGGGGADQESIDRLLDELNKLREEFEAHRDHANTNIDDLNLKMPTKADK